MWPNLNHTVVARTLAQDVKRRPWAYSEVWQNCPHVESFRSHNDKLNFLWLSKLSGSLCRWGPWDVAEHSVAEKALNQTLNWDDLVKDKSVLFDVLESKVRGDGLTSVDRLLPCCAVHFFLRFVKSTFVPVVFSQLSSIKSPFLYICTDQRSKHKTKCQFQWKLFLLVFSWLLQSFRVDAVTGNCYRLPSLHLILITGPFRGEDRFLKHGGWQTIRSSQSRQTNTNIPIQAKLPVHASFPFNNTVYSNVPGSGWRENWCCHFLKWLPCHHRCWSSLKYRTRESQWKPHERHDWYVKVQERKEKRKKKLIS